MTPVDVVNIALTEVGVSQTQVSSISPSDGSTEADVAAILYRPKLTALARAAHWNCLRKQAPLSLIKSAIVSGQISSDPPPRPWLYEYALPQDCLKARFILPLWNQVFTGVPFTTSEQVVPIFVGGPPVKFIVTTDKVGGEVKRVILTDMPQAIMVYTADFIDNPDLWDSHFLAAATATLAAWFVNALNRSRSLLQDQIAIAANVVAQARITDGNEGLTSADHMPDWMAARQRRAPFIGGGFYYQGWDALGFPGGSVI
jgi:hypothetical protein